MRDLVRVTLRRPVHDPVGGGQWNTGESAGFPPDVAQRLIARGAAVAAVSPTTKAPDRPGLDKQVKGAPVKK